MDPWFADPAENRRKNWTPRTEKEARPQRPTRPLRDWKEAQIPDEDVSAGNSGVWTLLHPVGADGAPASAPGDEGQFQQWYADHASRLRLNPDPDDPQHHYDYRAAYRAGTGPNAEGHWDSRFKADDHPNRYVDGTDTKTGQPLEPGMARSLAMPLAYGMEGLTGIGDLVNKGLYYAQNAIPWAMHQSQRLDTPTRKTDPGPYRWPPEPEPLGAETRRKWVGEPQGALERTLATAYAGLVPEILTGGLVGAPIGASVRDIKVARLARKGGENLKISDWRRIGDKQPPIDMATEQFVIADEFPIGELPDLARKVMTDRGASKQSVDRIVDGVWNINKSLDEAAAEVTRTHPRMAERVNTYVTPDATKGLIDWGDPLGYTKASPQNAIFLTHEAAVRRPEAIYGTTHHETAHQAQDFLAQRFPRTVQARAGQGADDIEKVREALNEKGKKYDYDTRGYVYPYPDPANFLKPYSKEDVARGWTPDAWSDLYNTLPEWRSRMEHGAYYSHLRRQLDYMERRQPGTGLTLPQQRYYLQHVNEMIGHPDADLLDWNFPKGQEVPNEISTTRKYTDPDNWRGGYDAYEKPFTNRPDALITLLRNKNRAATGSGTDYKHNPLGLEERADPGFFDSMSDRNARVYQNLLQEAQMLRQDLGLTKSAVDRPLLPRPYEIHGPPTPEQYMNAPGYIPPKPKSGGRPKNFRRRPGRSQSKP